MVLIHVSVKTREDVVNKFECTLREVVRNAGKVAGCIKYEWYRIPDSPQGYAIYGEFNSQEDFEEYLNSSIVQQIGAELIPLLVSPPDFKHYTATILEES